MVQLISLIWTVLPIPSIHRYNHYIQMIIIFFTDIRSIFTCTNHNCTSITNQCCLFNTNQVYNSQWWSYIEIVWHSTMLSHTHITWTQCTSDDYLCRRIDACKTILLFINFPSFLFNQSSDISLDLFPNFLSTNLWIPLLPRTNPQMPLCFSVRILR
jgi:hypothetical protein